MQMPFSPSSPTQRPHLGGAQHLGRNDRRSARSRMPNRWNSSHKPNTEAGCQIHWAPTSAQRSSPDLLCDAVRRRRLEHQPYFHLLSYRRCWQCPSISNDSCAARIQCTSRLPRQTGGVHGSSAGQDARFISSRQGISSRRRLDEPVLAPPSCIDCRLRRGAYRAAQRL